MARKAVKTAGLVGGSGSVRVVLTTVSSKEDAERVARELVKSRLAACVSFFPVTSTYEWKGRIETENEYLLIIKTSDEKVGDLVKWLQKEHPYEVPEIVEVFSAAHGKYADWMREVLKGPGEEFNRHRSDKNL